MDYSLEQNSIRRDQLMTQDEISEIDECISLIINTKGDMSALYTEWAEIEDYYENEIAEIKDMPNTRINILNSNVEGQTAMIQDQEISVMTEGESSADDEFADDARIGLEWTLRRNRFKKIVKSFIRKYTKFGAGCFTVAFDPKAVNNFGLTKIYSTSLTNIFVDGKLKDPLRFQECDWVAEAMLTSKTQLEVYYGKDKANAVVYGNNSINGKAIFNVDDSYQDQSATTLIKWWSRTDGKLRLREFTGDGTLMYDSHKPGTRKENQKEYDYVCKSYYKYVQDKYPFFFSFQYEREGNFWAMGDGKLLLPIQKLINRLYDNILICSRPDIPLIDTRSNIDVEEIGENSLGPIPYDGEELQGADPVHTIKWDTTNNNWFPLISALHNEAQRVTRFADIMTGQSSKSVNTATEAAIQQQQGSKATDDKKSDIQTTMSEMCEYILGIMVEKYHKGKSFKVKDNSSEYRWIDFRDMAHVPVRIPATKEFRDKFMKNNKDKIPQWQLLTNGDGNPTTKCIELDIEINIGAGLPKNKAFITKFLQDLAQVTLITQDGMQRPAIFWDEFREFMQKYVGLPIKHSDEIKSPPNPVQQGGQQTKSSAQQGQMADMPLGPGAGVSLSPTREAKQE